MLGARRFATYDVVRENLREAARRLATRGLLKNPDPLSWRPHAMRHSFKTEAEHAGVKSGIVEFFCGHVRGVEWVYDHRDEVHPDDLAAEYLKLEPYVSLNPDRAVVSEEFTGRERELRSEVDQLKRLYD
jgi:integrase